MELSTLSAVSQRKAALSGELKALAARRAELEAEDTALAASSRKGTGRFPIRQNAGTLLALVSATAILTTASAIRRPPIAAIANPTLAPTAAIADGAAVITVEARPENATPRSARPSASRTQVRTHLAAPTAASPKAQANAGFEVLSVEELAAISQAGAND